MGNKKTSTLDRTAYSYREALEAIGFYFDQQLYRSVFVAEVDDGYVGKARPAEEEANVHAEGFTFPFNDVRTLIANIGGAAVEPPAGGPPHCPYGYAAFMRAAGAHCDRAGASYVSVLELNNGFVLSYTTQSASGSERRRLMLDRVGIGELLNETE